MAYLACMQLKVKPFYELSLGELYQILKMRQEVFIMEQHCPYVDCDNLDQNALHLWYTNEDEFMAYARILPPSTPAQYASIGRILTSSKFRNQGLGRKLMEDAIFESRRQFPEASIKISAQNYLKDFYLNLGFEPVGESYLEDGLPHTQMILK